MTEWSEFPVFTATDSAGRAVTLPAPAEWEVVKSLDSPAHSFEGIFPYGEDYGELRDVEAVVGERVLFSGGIDERTVTEDQNGRRLKLIARSAGAVLLDNEALPQYYSAGASLADIFTRHIRPYGFTRVYSDYDVFLNRYQIVKGTSEWEAFSNFFRSGSQGIAYIEDSGRVVCRTNLVTGPERVFSNRDPAAQPYTALRIADNRYSPVTSFVIRDGDGVYSYGYDNPATASLGLTRKRYLIPAAEYTLSPTGGQIEAALRIRRSMLGKKVVTVTCPGLPDLAVCDLAAVDSACLHLEGLLVHQVRCRLSAAGISTEAVLVDKNYL